MRNAEAKNNSDGERDRWRYVSARGNDQTGEEQGLDEDRFKAFAGDLVLHSSRLRSTTTATTVAVLWRCAFAFGQRCGFDGKSGAGAPHAKMFAITHGMLACCVGFGFGASSAGAAFGDSVLCAGDAPACPDTSAMIFVVRALLTGQPRS